MRETKNANVNSSWLPEMGRKEKRLPARSKLRCTPPTHTSHGSLFILEVKCLHDGVALAPLSASISWHAGYLTISQRHGTINLAAWREVAAHHQARHTTAGQQLEEKRLRRANTSGKYKQASPQARKIPVSCVTRLGNRRRWRCAVAASFVVLGFSPHGTCECMRLHVHCRMGDAGLAHWIGRLGSSYCRAHCS